MSVSITRLILPALAILAVVAMIPKMISFDGKGPDPIEWLKMPGSAVDIDIAMDGTAWIVSDQGTVMKWTGMEWQDMGGNAKHIAAGPAGQVWITDAENHIYRRSPDGWVQMPGTARDIAIGASGAIWKLGTDKSRGGYRVYKWGETEWVLDEEAAGVRIAVGPKGNPWIVDDKNQIYRLTRMVWKQAPDKAVDISISANGMSWIVGPPSPGGTDGPVSAWGGKSWVQNEGQLSVIAADPRNFPWGINSKNEIFADSRSVALKPKQK